MIIDTHCHLNMIVKKEFDRALTDEECQRVKEFIDSAQQANVDIIINVGTSLVESHNCVKLATMWPSVFATIGIHPNDATSSWKDEMKELKKMASLHKVVGIGECGIDRHYPDYNLERQSDVFKAQIELALEHDLALVIHSRDAADETLKILDAYSHEKIRGTMHCFSYDVSIAQESQKLGFYLGIGGAVTYPKNEILRTVVKAVGLSRIVLETDAPFLPPQFMRGKTNTPAQTKTVANFCAELLTVSAEEVALTTTAHAVELFRLNKYLKN